jgi:hypothetical protein
MCAQGDKERAAFTKWLCRELTGACTREAPPLPKDRKKGPAFKTADPQDLELNKMMANMKACALTLGVTIWQSTTTWSRARRELLSLRAKDAMVDVDQGRNQCKVERPELPGCSSAFLQHGTETKLTHLTAACLCAGRGFERLLIQQGRGYEDGRQRLRRGWRRGR